MMNAKTIHEMTEDELKRLVNETVDQRLRTLLGEFELDEFDLTDEPEDTRTWEEVKASIKRNRWTPPPGTPSVVDLLREDQER